MAGQNIYEGDILMAIRLTQYIREEIRDSIVSPAFDLRTNSLKCSEQSLAQRAYSTLVSQSQQATMNTLPQSVFAWRSNVMISARRGSETIRLLGVNREAWQTLQLESPVAWGSTGSSALEMEEGVLFDEFVEHNALVEALSKEKVALDEKVKGILASATTLERLLVIWPEIRDFTPVIDALEATARTEALPAVQIHEVSTLLSKLIGTKVETVMAGSPA